jgi:hypothetical protein
MTLKMINMKQVILRTAFILVLLASLSASAQTVYWREGFEGGNISTTNALTGGPNNYYATSANSGGFWFLHNAYRTTGTSCAPTYGANHIRLLQNGADSPYIVTPTTPFGVNEIHVSRSANSTTAGARTRRLTIFVRSDTIGNTNPFTAGSGWVRVSFVPSSDAFCVDTAIIVPSPLNATTRRVAIGTSQLANADIDSIWLVSNTTFVAPVTFNGISANFNNGLVKVSWSNETESNTDQYQIERSSDGRSFQSVGAVDATNNRNYSWFDYSPIVGSSFYRIKAVDRDGKLSFSGTVRVNTSKTAQQLVVAPNPIQNNLLNVQISNIRPGNYTLNLINSAGQPVYTAAFRSEGTSLSRSFQLPASVTRGIYTLQVSDGTKKQKLVVSVK